MFINGADVITVRQYGITEITLVDKNSTIVVLVKILNM